MVYEITTDCRIANKDYKKGDLVTVNEIGQYYPTIMAPVTGEIKAKPIAKVDEPKEEKVDEYANEEIADEDKAEEVEPVEEKPTKSKGKSKKK
jgi:hypothetical protein